MKNEQNTHCLAKELAALSDRTESAGSALALQQTQNLFIYVDGTTRQRISKRELKLRIIEIASTLREPNDTDRFRETIKGEI